MKKLLATAILFLTLFIFSVPAFADSPITESDISRAYMDVAIVKEASQQHGKINANISSYLSNAKNPIDVKAAVINALSWSSDGKANADAYSKTIYKVPVSKLKTDSLSGDQLFCIGYLMAMDNYTETKSALSFLKLAEKKSNNSFTVSIIRAVVESQNGDDSIWNYFKPLLQNSNLKKDMRQDAVNIILNYVALYEEKGDIVTSQDNFIVENGKNQKIYFYGGFAEVGPPFEVVGQSDRAYAAVLKDKYDVFYLNVTGLVNGNSSLQVMNPSNKIKTINFAVVSPEAFKKLDNQVAMYAGSTKVLKGKIWSSVSTAVVPYIKNDMPYVPVDYVTSATGGKMVYDSKKGTYSITYSGKTIIAKSGSNVLTVNNKQTKISANAETKSQVLFMPAKDLAAAVGKNFVYYNGLIMFTDPKTVTDTKSEDYILEEISNLLNGGKSALNYPVPYEQDEKYGYKDSTGKVVIKPVFDVALDFSEGLAAVAVINDQGDLQYGFINLKGEYVVKPAYEWAHNFSGGIAPVTKGDYAGYIDKNGKTAINVNYSGVGVFSGALAPVMEYDGTKWGYTDPSGKLIIQYKYDDCGGFSEGMAAVKVGDKWGYVDRKGKMVIQPVFDSADSFYNGTADVTIYGNLYTINKSGKAIIYFDGDIYAGEVNWENGLLEGKGVYTFYDGEQYTGEFSDSNFNGYGVYTFLDGDVMDGNWEAGKANGKGKYTWTDGDWYEGNFSDGKRNGYGIYTHEDGTIEEGNWKDGELIDD